MPTYTFRCPKCQYKFTDSFPMRQSDGRGIVCPKCKTKDLERVWQGSFSIGKSSQKGSKRNLPCPTCPSGVCSLNRFKK